MDFQHREQKAGWVCGGHKHRVRLGATVGTAAGSPRRGNPTPTGVPPEPRVRREPHMDAHTVLSRRGLVPQAEHSPAPEGTHGHLVSPSQWWLLTARLLES